MTESLFMVFPRRRQGGISQKGIYYYTTYDNHQITAVDMHRAPLDGAELTRYPLVTGEQIRFQN